jgi:hypothetical protein
MSDYKIEIVETYHDRNVQEFDILINDIRVAYYVHDSVDDFYELYHNYNSYEYKDDFRNINGFNDLEELERFIEDQIILDFSF